MLGEEPVPPYRRPPLSKTYLSGDIGEEALYIKPRAAYAKQDIDLRTGVRVTAIDRQAHTISLDNGERDPELAEQWHEAAQKFMQDYNANLDIYTGYRVLHADALDGGAE